MPPEKPLLSYRGTVARLFANCLWEERTGGKCEGKGIWFEWFFFLAAALHRVLTGKAKCMSSLRPFEESDFFHFLVHSAFRFHREACLLVHRDNRKALCGQEQGRWGSCGRPSSWEPEPLVPLLWQESKGFGKEFETQNVCGRCNLSWGQISVLQPVLT